MKTYDSLNRLRFNNLIQRRREENGPSLSSLTFGSSGLVVFKSPHDSIGAENFEINYVCPPRCIDKKKEKVCKKQKNKGKCGKKSMKKKCAKTCGHC